MIRCSRFARRVASFGQFTQPANLFVPPMSRFYHPTLAVESRRKKKQLPQRKGEPKLVKHHTPEGFQYIKEQLIKVQQKLELPENHMPHFWDVYKHTGHGTSIERSIRTKWGGWNAVAEKLGWITQRRVRAARKAARYERRMAKKNRENSEADATAAGV